MCLAVDFSIGNKTHVSQGVVSDVFTFSKLGWAVVSQSSHAGSV